MTKYNYLNKISFEIPDNSSILGIGTHAFDRLGPERILNNYKIISITDSDWYTSVSNTKIYSLESVNPHFRIDKNNTYHIMISKEFEEIINSIQNPYLLTYKPSKKVNQYAKERGWSLLSNDYKTTSKLENKVEIRNILKDKVSFAPYIIFEIDKVPSYSKVKSKLGSKIVVQDSTLSGGKGTFIIDNEEKYNDTIEKLKTKKRKEGVISKFIEGEVTSIQCCATKYGSFFAGLQEQIISDPTLLNPQINGSGTFTGGAWNSDKYDKKILDKAKSLCEIIGEEIYNLGFRGIFAPDLIISEGEIFVVELNARISGMTPFINMSQIKNKEVPFILLHILENGDFEYTIDDIKAIKESHLHERYGTFMILHNKKDTDVEIKSTIKAGVYNYSEEGEIKFSHPGYSLEDILEDNQIIINGMPNKGTKKGSGKRLGRIISNKYHFSNKNLDQTVRNIIRSIENSII